MGGTFSKEDQGNGEKFNSFINGYARKIIAVDIPQEIVTMILLYTSYNFIDYDGKFIKENVGKKGVNISQNSALTVVYYNKGHGGSARMDKPLPRIGSNLSEVYVWHVKFISSHYTSISNIR